MKHARVLLSASIVAALAGVVLLDFGASSPGELARVHANVAELTGSSGCTRCHGDTGSTLRSSCAQCHEDIEAQLHAKRGLHGRLAVELVSDCGQCHVDHRGASFDLVGDRSFVAAGVQGGRSDYRHAGFSFALEGRHDELECVKCHAHADDSPLAKGTKRFLGLSQACESCHEDPHTGRLPNCASCHGQQRPFAEAARFVHDARFPLTGSHQGVACKQCHDPKSARSIEALGKLRDAGTPALVRTCAECHRHGHSAAMIAATASRGGARRANVCLECHEVADKDFDVASRPRMQELHEVTGLRLDAPHDRVDCAACHEGPLAERYRGRDPKHCATCHETAHQKEFLAAVATRAALDAGVTCETCHGGGRRSFSEIDEAANRRLHDATGFALDAPHDRAACVKCHKGIGEEPEVSSAAAVHRARFPGRMAADCVACHSDPHDGQFVEGSFAGATCAVCHGKTAFAPVAFGQVEHGKTAFPLTGAHLAVGCRVCHKPAKAGQSVTFRDAPSRCGECHTDVHDGYFGRRDCAPCHKTESFEVKEFDHARWTRFPLAGRHEKAACSKCHPTVRATHGGARTMAKATQDCADCHRDPHAGQFRIQGRTDCAKCHTPQGGFDMLSFDHGKHSRFQLDEQHAKLDCAKCHKSYDLPRGGKVVRYKPLGTRCSDCHAWKREVR